jgi:hypothetical protein
MPEIREGIDPKMNHFVFDFEGNLLYTSIEDPKGTRVGDEFPDFTAVFSKIFSGLSGPTLYEKKRGVLKIAYLPPNFMREELQQIDVKVKEFARTSCLF